MLFFMFERKGEDTRYGAPHKHFWLSGTLKEFVKFTN